MTDDPSGSHESGPLDPGDFYTGLVAELYAALRSSDPDPEPIARFVARHGTPALELGCGDGDPIIELRQRGLDIEGLDVSADMLDRCRRRAADAGVDVVLHHASMTTMDLGRRYRSIVIAGPTFNLLVDDDAAVAALRRIAAHLADDGAALVPLFIPPVVTMLGRGSESVTDTGAVIRCTPIASERDEDARLQTVTLRYERESSTGVERLDRVWHIHWYTPSLFRRLAESAGLDVVCCIDPTTRSDATDDATYVVTTLCRRRPDSLDPR